MVISSSLLQMMMVDSTAECRPYSLRYIEKKKGALHYHESPKQSPMRF
jgi:hypothetical protein